MPRRRCSAHTLCRCWRCSRTQDSVKHIDDRWYWASSEYPAADVNLRNIAGPVYTIQDASQDNRVIGTMDEVSALAQLHTHAVYLHGADTLLRRIARPRQEDRVRRQARPGLLHPVDPDQPDSHRRDRGGEALARRNDRLRRRDRHHHDPDVQEDQVPLARQPRLRAARDAAAVAGDGEPVACAAGIGGGGDPR